MNSEIHNINTRYNYDFHQQRTKMGHIILVSKFSTTFRLI
jgi:hypothetical protein